MTSDDGVDERWLTGDDDDGDDVDDDDGCGMEEDKVEPPGCIRGTEGEGV